MSLPAAIFRNDETARQLVFDQPREIILARNADEFAPALERAQAASDPGKWLAGYFSYEAGYLLEPKLVLVEPRPWRAFQGWRYLASENCPRDLDRVAPGAKNMPEAMRRELRELGLL